MQNNSDQINQLNQRLQKLQGQLEEKRNQMNSKTDVSSREFSEENIRGVENDLKVAETALSNSKKNLSGLVSKLSEAKKVYDRANIVAKKNVNQWINQYMPHLSNQETFVDAFICENQDFQYTLFEQPDPYGDDSPRIDPAFSYVKQYNQSRDARVHGQVKQAADPFFHLNEHNALESIRSSISQCQSESGVVKLFQGYLVYGSGNDAHKKALQAMANYFFSNKSRVANQNDTDMNNRLRHFLHYIQANDAGQYNFSEKISDNGWITSNYKTCFENLFQSRKILLRNKWDEFGRLENLCQAVSVQKPLMDCAQSDFNAGQAKVSEKQRAIVKIKADLELMRKYNQLYKEWNTIKNKIDKLKNQISKLSNDPRESKQPQSASPSHADRGNKTKLKLTPAWTSDLPPKKNNTSSNLCDRLKTHYQSIKEKEKDFFMTEESINARISAADKELKGMDFSKVSESDFVNHHAKFGLGGIFTMKRFSYLLKMRYRHEKFIQDDQADEFKIYKKLMENFLLNNFEISPMGLFDGVEVSLEKRGDINEYFKELRGSSLFFGGDGFNQAQDFSKALHIQDRLQLLSKYLAKTPEERIQFCSSFQASDACEMRGQRKGRFLRILSVNCLETLKKNNPNRQDNIDGIIKHLEGLPVSSVVKVYKAVQAILNREGHSVQWDSHFWQLSRHRQEGQLDKDLESLYSQVQQASRDEDANEAISQRVTPIPKKVIPKKGR